MKFVLALLFAAIFFAVVHADLPVHCLHEQIRGEWFIYKGPLNENIEPYKCPSTGLSDVSDIITVTFKAPNVVMKQKKTVGTWTMVYDQGFEFTVDNQIFFAFNKYEKNQTDNYITSYCGETSYGWYRAKSESKHGCYYARKINIKPEDISVSLPINSLLYLSPEEAKKLNTHQNDKALVDSINEHEDWEAESYSFWEEMTDADIQRISGVQLSNEALESILQQSKLNAEKTLSDEQDEVNEARRAALPKNWDWRNVDGVNYVGEVRDQSLCGSCYAFAATAAIESRIRIKTKNAIKSVISPQQVISCSDYNQGCHGGFPFMVGKHGFDYYLVPEDCYVYKGEKGNCSATCTDPKYRVKVNRYEYIGGYYGANTELGMMEEIYKHGPIPVNYLVYPDFHYYKKGIYKHHNKHKTPFNIKTSTNGVKHWEATTHAVTIVGWGEHEATSERYWICKNSWSKRWGMDGYFLIRRGVDECAIEMQASALDPEIIENL